MNVTDELRKYATHYERFVGRKLVEIADRIDYAVQCESDASYNKGYDDGFDDGFASADDWLAQHEDAMAKHGWMRGPLDTDGKMWHSGDMSDSTWGVIEDITYNNGTWYIKGHDTIAPWMRADSVRHYHKPTVEDVINELLFKWPDCETPEQESALKARIVAKLRLANDGEE